MICSILDQQRKEKWKFARKGVRREKESIKLARSRLWPTPKRTVAIVLRIVKRIYEHDDFFEMLPPCGLVKLIRQKAEVFNFPRPLVLRLRMKQS